ncbi:phage Gp37/Gp68 family protein [Desulfovibrio sp. OttesenSCG-928-C06]|nr:phage Gp37/Gp68 family protein [Desulfovibrio sp. OttesenSCG-928-C06]
MNNTKIEWCDVTWNPVTGCPGPKVSPGCANCYAERMVYSRLRGRCGYHTALPFDIHTHADRWLQPVKYKKPKRIFTCSMGDLFHERVSFGLVAKVFAVAALCPQHTFMILTKRPERMRAFMTDTSCAANDRRGTMYQLFAGQAGLDPCMDGLRWPLSNVWLGVTVCNQAEADVKIPVLLDTPAAKRFVSVEPMLGPINLGFRRTPTDRDYRGWNGDGPIDYVETARVDEIQWVICGGETGPKARPVNYAWVYKLAEQCWGAGTPFFFKGWGEWTPAFYQPDGGYKVHQDASIPDGFKATPHIFAENPGIRMYRVGKRCSGRLLNEREWNEVPV